MDQYAIYVWASYTIGLVLLTLLYHITWRTLQNAEGKEKK